MKGTTTNNFVNHPHERTSVAGLELMGLRPNSHAAATHLRSELPMVLSGIIAEIDGAEMELSLCTGEDGMVAVTLCADAGSATASVLAEFAAVLEPVAESASVVVEPSLDAVVWPVVTELRANSLGFVAEAAVTEPTAVAWCGTAERSTTQLMETFAAHPGTGVSIRIRPGTHHDRRIWDVRMSVVTRGEEPSIRLRSSIRRRHPGLRLGSVGDDAPWLRVSQDQLVNFLDIPVAGSEPLPGSYTAAAAPIPVSPSRGSVGSGLCIGHALTSSGRRTPIELSKNERLRHIHVLGQTGTGKSSALAGIARQVAEGDGGMLIADPHGQLCERVLAEMPDSASDRVWLIRCGDTENPVPINPLAETDVARRDIAISELCAMFQYLFDKAETGIVGPRFSERVAMTLRTLAEAHGPRASLLDVPETTGDDEFMESVISGSADARLRRWWKVHKMERSSNEHGQVLAWVNSKFDSISSTVAMRAILGSGTNAIDFAKAMDEGKIILLDLSKSELGEQASRLLGYLYLGRIWHGALEREHRARPFTVIVDEAHTLISGALTNMLAEGRKFGLSVVLAHQHMAQLDIDLGPAVKGNVATTIAFRSAVSDANEIRQRFGDMVDTSTLVTLPDLTAVTLRSAAAGPAFPHTLVIDHNERGYARAGRDLDDHIAEVMRRTYLDIVDPYRVATVAAGRGVSNLTALARPKAPEPGSGGGPPQKPAPRPGSSGSFLDEWLEKRKGLVQSAVSDPEHGD
ncbi:type IV secretion system DNA-binding domain-containing protein [Mycobacterium sp. ITM-2016-00316]|uniref:type IV secretory system conjugative DNA transfer family protein n=1 Tax=Mycobacterium sp. ITM-2016-00316 TaxID=2099695 RepID=UPI001304D502|nr:DUF87 domain-containing protein [Mycobacterium sp. ITM-2016-00316]WNG81159.1 type IV secretion system DNA-binding domain-containing protein [Mycobacterium sp. ITM-2016-00316]